MRILKEFFSSFKMLSLKNDIKELKSQTDSLTIAYNRMNNFWMASQNNVASLIRRLTALENEVRLLKKEAEND